MENNHNLFNDENRGWVEKILIPLTDILSYIEEIELIGLGLNKKDFIKDGNILLIQLRLRQIYKCLKKLRKYDPPTFEKYFYKTVGGDFSEFLFYYLVGRIINRGLAAAIWLKIWQATMQRHKEPEKHLRRFHRPCSRSAKYFRVRPPIQWRPEGIRPCFPTDSA